LHNCTAQLILEKEASKKVLVVESFLVSCSFSTCRLYIGIKSSSKVFSELWGHIKTIPSFGPNYLGTYTECFLSMLANTMSRLAAL
jgi:hypothetical protein